MIRRCGDHELQALHHIINDAAEAYRDAIPADCWHVPYMSLAELRREIKQGVMFWGFEAEGELLGAMGLQLVRDVALIRHAYVRTSHQRQGIGSALLLRLRSQTDRPLLAGTWADAPWAIRFYERHGFRLVSKREKARLLHAYWTIPDRQIETSVVLACPRWFSFHPDQAPEGDADIA
jgi:GNAT superfamily N-acetyltransferase